MKRQEGVTLVALIITIIILLVLVTVTINTTRNQGVIDHAKNAASNYTALETRERIQLAYQDFQSQSLTDDSYTFQEALEAEHLTVTSVTKIGSSYEVTVSTSEGVKTYTVDANGIAQEQ